MSARTQFALALLLDVLASAGVLLIGTREWQTVTTPGPFRADVLGVLGRTVDPLPTACAVVALAGALAVVATRGVVRRGIGVVLAVAGAVICWRSLAAAAAIGTSRARDLVRDEHPSAASATAVPDIDTHTAWPVLSLAGGVLVLAAGLLAAWRGAKWTSMSMRYESPVAKADPDEAERTRARADAALWTALDRGDDPTESDPRDIE